MPSQESAKNWPLHYFDFSHERLQRAFPRANQLHWIAQYIHQVGSLSEVGSHTERVVYTQYGVYSARLYSKL